MHLHQFHIQSHYQIMPKANLISLNSNAFARLLNNLAFIMLQKYVYLTHTLGSVAKRKPAHVFNQPYEQNPQYKLDILLNVGNGVFMQSQKYSVAILRLSRVCG